VRVKNKLLEKLFLTDLNKEDGLFYKIVIWG
jgi:hypothetical protein